MNRILILLTSGLGNCVQATPAILEIRRLRPDTRLIILGPQQNLDLLHTPALADEWIELPPKQSLMRFLFSHPRLLFRKYEAVFSFYCCNPGRLILLKRLGMIKNIFSIRDQANRGYQFDHELDARAEYHEAQMGLDLIRQTGWNVQNRPTDLCLSEEEKENGKLFLEKKGITDPLIIHPSWTHIGQIKGLPFTFVVKLLKNLSNEGIPAYILLGKEEELFLNGTNLTEIPQERILSGIRTPRMLASVLSAAKLVISADSGPGHIAGAAGTQVFTIWGPSCPKRSAVYSKIPAVNFTSENCQKHCYEYKEHAECLIGCPCMDHDEKQIFSAIQKYWNRARPQQTKQR